MLAQYIHQRKIMNNLLYTVIMAVITSACMQGCATITHGPSQSGPDLCGFFAQQETITAKEGFVLRITSPGVTLSLNSFFPGITLGWHEALFFMPDDEESNPIAIQKKNYGVSVGPNTLMLGYERRLTIIPPKGPESIDQTLSIHQDFLPDSIISREEIQ